MAAEDQRLLDFIVLNGMSDDIESLDSLTSVVNAVPRETSGENTPLHAHELKSVLQRLVAAGKVEVMKERDGALQTADVLVDAADPLWDDLWFRLTDSGRARLTELAEELEH